MSDSTGRRNSESDDENDGEKVDDSSRIRDLVRKFCEDVACYLNKQETPTVTVSGDSIPPRYEVSEEKGCEGGQGEIGKKVIEKRSDHTCQLEDRRPLILDTGESSLRSSVSSFGPSLSSGYSTSSQWSSSTTASELDRRLENALAENERLRLEVLQLGGSVNGLERRGGNWLLVRRTAERWKDGEHHLREGSLAPIQEQETSRVQFTTDKETICKFAGLRNRIAKLKEATDDEKNNELLTSIDDQLETLMVQWSEAQEEGTSLEFRGGLSEIEHMIAQLETDQNKRKDDAQLLNHATRYLDNQETLTVTLRGDGSGRRYDVSVEKSEKAFQEVKKETKAVQTHAEDQLTTLKNETEDLKQQLNAEREKSKNLLAKMAKLNDELQKTQSEKGEVAEVNAEMVALMERLKNQIELLKNNVMKSVVESLKPFIERVRAGLNLVYLSPIYMWALKEDLDIVSNRVNSLPEELCRLKEP